VRPLSEKKKPITKKKGLVKWLKAPVPKSKQKTENKSFLAPLVSSRQSLILLFFTQLPERVVVAYSHYVLLSH
jgi:hypothetical protein